MSIAKPTPYSLEAYNTAKHSENKMHDDTVAKQFGFTGGLVPGVDVYAYMSHVPLQVWGRAFLERGEMEGRFIKPVYDGEIANVTATEANGGLDIQIESRGIVCGTGHAKLMPAPAKASLDDFKTSIPPANDKRPDMDASSYKVGEWLAIHPYKMTPELHAQYLKDIREADPIYAREGLIHSGTLLRLANWALTHNVRLGPWIHVGSTIQQITPGHVGDELTLRARVTGNYEKKGHKLVDLDCLVIANGKTALARIQHTAIYAPRMAAAA
jgi:acyl dehydratase